MCQHINIYSKSIHRHNVQGAIEYSKYAFHPISTPHLCNYYVICLELPRLLNTNPSNCNNCCLIVVHISTILRYTNILKLSIVTITDNSQGDITKPAADFFASHFPSIFVVYHCGLLCFVWEGQVHPFPRYAMYC